MQQQLQQQQLQQKQLQQKQLQQQQLQQQRLLYCPILLMGLPYFVWVVPRRPPDAPHGPGLKGEQGKGVGGMWER